MDKQPTKSRLQMRSDEEFWAIGRMNPVRSRRYTTSDTEILQIPVVPKDYFRLPMAVKMRISLRATKSIQRWKIGFRMMLRFIFTPVL